MERSRSQASGGGLILRLSWAYVTAREGARVRPCLRPRPYGRTAARPPRQQIMRFDLSPAKSFARWRTEWLQIYGRNDVDKQIWYLAIWTTGPAVSLVHTIQPSVRCLFSRQHQTSCCGIWPPIDSRTYYTQICTANAINDS